MPFRALSLLLACVPLFCSSAVQADDFQFRDQERVVFVGGSLAERMNLFGHFETLLHSRFPEKQLVIRNFGWPADEVGIQQRPVNYYRIDDPLEVFGPELFLCFFGFNEHFAGDPEADVTQFQDRYRDWINRSSEKYSKPGREARFVLISPMAFENANDRHLPDGKQNNQSLKKYSAAIQALAAELDLPFVDVLTASSQAFASEPGKQSTTNGIHVTDRNRGPSGSYVLDPMSQRFRYFKTPGYGNPWCMVFDRWGMGVIGDGTNAQQHWASPLSGFNVSSRRTLRPLFYNQGMRPACGSEFLVSRHLPDSIQGQFIYACVINMHGLPRFDVADEDGTAGYVGKRIENLLESEDGFFRPIDPQVGPDGAVWFGDWCNALIGHMQYSQRDPNRDHEHGRIYRLVNKNKPLVQPELQAEATISELLDQLQSYELRTRYRARRELRARPQADVLNAVNQWIAGEASAEKLAEALWVQEGARAVDPALVARLMKSDNFHARSAAVHTVANEMLRFDFALDVFRQAIKDEHPRGRLEAIRALSFVQTYEALEIVLLAVDQPLDYWWEYTMEHTFLALRKMGGEADSRGELLVNSSETAREYYDLFLRSTGPGGEAIKPLLVAQDEEASASAKALAVRQLVNIRGGSAKDGEVVYRRVCASCHMIGDQGNAFGPKLAGVASRNSKEQIIRHVLYPNETIAKDYETVLIITVQGKTHTGFILDEDDQQIVLGVATDDGKGKRLPIAKDDIDEREEVKASSMPEGLVKTIAPAEFLDLIEFLAEQSMFVITKDGWIETGLADDGALRKKGEFIEVSRDAELQLGSGFEDRYSKFAHLVLSAVGASNHEFLFHSAGGGSNNPAIAIRLKQPTEIRAIDIQNRRNRQFYDRAKDMAVWISDDGKDWQQVWKSKKPAENYSIELPAGTTARYVKIGIDGRGILHLNQVVVYGSAGN